jgi:perosamine synthetase
VPEPIVLMRPYVPEAAIDAVSAVLRSRWIGQGPKTEEFERRFSDLYQRPALAVGSCTDALHLAYIMAGIGPGDEVIAPLFTCTATNIPLLYQGAKIRFADVARGSLNVDPAAVAAMVNERTKAIVVVHYGGAVVLLSGLMSARIGTGIPIIEDCAQALGASAIGNCDYSCFSFQAVKHVTTGDGGMLLLPKEQAQEARRRRWFGIDRQAKLDGTWANDISELGYKYQMTDIGAAMGLAGLDTLDNQVARRRSLAMLYATNLRTTDGIWLLDYDPQGAAWLMTVAVERREDLRRKLKDAGIESDQVHYRNDRYSIFKEFRGEFPNMDAIDSKYLCLPLHAHMSHGDVNRVCEVIKTGW